MAMLIRYDKAYYIGEQDFYVPRDAEGELHRSYEDAHRGDGRTSST